MINANTYYVNGFMKNFSKTAETSRLPLFTRDFIKAI